MSSLAQRGPTVPTRLLGAVRRAFGEFLALPVLVIAAFVLLAVLLYAADSAWSQGRGPAGLAFLGRLLGDAGSLGSLLSTIASSIITVTSITFSLLLIALQQGSSALTAQVTDQFLMRRSNQFYFGYFVGLSIYVLMTLVTVSRVHLPVFGTVAALVLTAVALCMIVVMIYNTIDQMRPDQIVRAIRGHVLRARERERDLLAETRRTPREDWSVVATVSGRDTGHGARIDLAALRAALRAGRDADDLELEIVRLQGSFVAFGDPIARIRARPGTWLGPDEREALEEAIRRALKLGDGRDLTCDPDYGLTQLATIGWTSISTAKSNPSPGIAVIESLRDILARWFADGPAEEADGATIVCPDTAVPTAIDALELVACVASESIQAPTLAAVLRSVTLLLPAAPPEAKEALAAVVRRSLSALGEHVPTRDLLGALREVEDALAHVGEPTCARDVARARIAFESCIGELNSRSTRVPGTKDAGAVVPG